MRSERTRSIDEAGGDGFRDLVAVAGRQHDALDAEFAQVMQQRLGAGAQFVGQDHQAGELAVDRDGDRERAGRPVAAERGEAGIGDLAGDEMRAADHDQAAVDPADDALAGRLHHLGRDRQRQALAARLGDDGLRDDVL